MTDDIRAGAASTPNLKNLYPHLNVEELEEVEDALDHYVALVLRIYERICQDPEAYERFRTLTEARRPSMMTEGQGRNPPLNP